MSQPEFTIRTSDEQQEFATGAKRDSQEGKTRFDLLPIQPLIRTADHYAKGAVHYGEYNWQKGFPFRRTYASILRHIFAWALGERSEDHLAAVVFGCFALMQYEYDIQRNAIDPKLNDMGVLQ